MIYETGSFEVVPETAFDTILANINRNVLIQHAGNLSAKLHRFGHLLLSGVLVTDRMLIRAAFEKFELSIVEEAEEGEWWLGVLCKRNNSDTLSS